MPFPSFGIEKFDKYIVNMNWNSVSTLQGTYFMYAYYKVPRRGRKGGTVIQYMYISYIA
jgi:hypothetical protein